MSAEFKAYIVVSPLPIVIEDDSGSTSYNPGDIFEALDNNVSVVRHLALNKIVETTGVPFTGGIFVSQGDPGPIGPTGPIGVSGETNTSSNAGGTVGLALPKVGFDLPFKGLTAGSGIILTPTPNTVVITSGGETNTSSNAGGTVGLALPKVGADLPLKGLTAGANITLTPSATDITIDAAATGEANTTSNAGGTEGLALAKVGADLPLKGLSAGANITLTPSATDVLIVATVPTVPAPEDENNVLANQVFS